MRPTGTCRLVLAMLVAGPLVACEARNLVPDAGTGAGGTGEGGGGAGAGGSGGSGGVTFPSLELLSNFDDLEGATVVRIGTPPRNGYWYAYNDASATCVQTPAVGAHYIGETPPTPPPWSTFSAALHGLWSGCTTWGAGIGADINTPVVPDGGVYTGPKVAYDVGAFNAITFFAMAAPGSDTLLRLKVLTLTATLIQDGGTCDESTIGAGRCGDHYGEQFNLTSNGTWKQITVTFSNPAFRQEGWGAWFPFVPRDVTGIQIQSVDKAEAYDFWIDDMYLLR